MIFIFLAILATIAVSSIVFAVINIVRDGRLTSKLELSRHKDKILTLKEIKACINIIQHDTTDSETNRAATRKAIEKLERIAQYIKKYY